jgi:hypothetical protein
VFRVRLAADGVGYFTIRGVASEPLRIVLLMGRVSPVVSAAATVLERTAMGIMSVVGVGDVSPPSRCRPTCCRPRGRTCFAASRSPAGMVCSVRCCSDADRPLLRPLIEAHPHAHRQWRWAGGRTVRAISAVEDLFSEARANRSRRHSDARRSRAIACYWLMALEVVPGVLGDRPADLAVGRHDRRNLHAIGERAGRRHSRQLGALEASNVAVVKALGLAGGGSLALFRAFAVFSSHARAGTLPRDTMTSKPAAPVA